MERLYAALIVSCAVFFYLILPPYKDDRQLIQEYLKVSNRDDVVLRSLAMVRNRRNDPALHRAMREGRLDVVKALLNLGVGRLTGGQHQMEPIHVAAALNNIQMVRLFEDRAYAFDARRKTPLHMAALAQLSNGGLPKIAKDAFKNSPIVVRILLNNRAPVDIKDEEGWTPLHEAALSGNVGAAKELLSENPPLDATGMYNWTPLHRATYYGKERMVKLLLEYGNFTLEMADKFGCTALNIAVNRSYTGIVDQLLKNRAQVDTLCNDTTPLMMAAINGDLEILNMLIGAGADISAKNSAGDTVLHKVCDAVHSNVIYVTVVKQLLPAGAFIRAKDRRGRTPLHRAAISGSLRVAKFLIQEGADIQAKDWDQMTPLHFASLYGHEDVVNSLLRLGADKAATEAINSRTPLHLAAAQGHYEIVHRLLKEHAYKEPKDDFGLTPVAVAAKHGHEKVLAVLLAAGVNRESRDLNNYTPLTIATIHGYIKCVKLLLKAGANREAKSVKGDTPLILASYFGHLEIVWELENAGANKHARNHLWQNAIHQAAVYGHYRVINFLMTVGVKGNIRDKRGMTALDIATKENHKAIVMLLKSTYKIEL